ncbi:MAG: hypothetical protein RR292_06680 [Christensenellaceae bacterium]
MKNDNPNKKLRIASDFGLNIIASAVTVIALQLIVFPYLAKINTAEVYGVLLTIVGIVNVLIGVFGNSLNNVRLVQERLYQEKGKTGDFNLLFGASAAISAIVMLVMTFWFPELDGSTRLLLIVFVVVGVAREYYSVAYRLTLDFKKNLISRVIVSVFYVVGVLFAQYTNLWPLAFISGEAAGYIYVLCTTKLHKEPIKKTELFSHTSKKFITLLGASAIASSLLYVDRLLIYPMLGADSVSTYTVASFFGKSLGMLMVPIAGVLLSYFAQKNFKMNRRKFVLTNGLALLGGIAFAVIAYFISPWFTGLLYPTLIESAVPYIQIANLAAIIGAVAAMAQPAVLQYCNTLWQVLIQVIFAATYIVLGIWFMQLYGLMGFCVAALLANIIRLLLFYIIGFVQIK